MYHAILFSPSGDYVTDFRGCKTKQEVWDRVADMGSRWFFYPFAFVATSKTIVSAREGLADIQGKRLKSVKNLFKIAGERFPDSMNAVGSGDWPLELLVDLLFDRE